MQFLRKSGGILYLQQMDWVAYVAALVCKYRPQYRVDIVELLADKTVLELKIVAVAFFIPWGIYSNEHKRDPYLYVNYLQKLCKLENLRIKNLKITVM